MIDALTLSKNNDYVFDETKHVYYYKGNKVNTSVTAFISRYYKAFDTETISANYAKKHGMLQEDVKKMWADAGNISAMAGTVIHSYLENANRQKTVPEDYSKAISEGLGSEVKDRVKILMPKAKSFITDTHNKLFPLALEYTVGYEDKLAGNIDMLAWNEKAQEIQIWDYKNVKSLDLENKYQQMYSPFDDYDDCNYIHYSLQLSFYKAMAQKLLGINIGKMYLVHFNYLKEDDTFDIYQATDFTNLCYQELNKL